MTTEPTAPGEDPTLGPDGPDAVDLNPERCAVIFAPYEQHPTTELRCTKRADDEGHEHQWNSDEQERWIDETITVFRDAMGDDEPLQATPYEVWRWDCPVCGEVNDADDVEPSGDETCSGCHESVEVKR